MSLSIRKVFELETYLSFNGRIGRQTYWLSGGLFLTIFLLFQYLLSLFFGFRILVPRDLTDVQEFTVIYHQKAVRDVIGCLISTYPILAINAKRLKDRGRSPWWLLPIFAPGILVVMLGVSDYEMIPSVDETGHVYAARTLIAEILTWLSLATQLAAFIDLGLLRGTEGPNQYGNDRWLEF